MMFVPYCNSENQEEPTGVEVLESLLKIDIDGDGLNYAKPDASDLVIAEYLNTVRARCIAGGYANGEP
jgi:hypothetical protein